MPQVFTRTLTTPVFNGKISCNTGLFISDKFVDALDRKTIEVIDPSTERNGDHGSRLRVCKGWKTFLHARTQDLMLALKILRYFAGWADKVKGKTIETEKAKFAYTCHEPIGVCGLITPWNFPLMIATSKIAPALATGSTVVLKPSEVTPLDSLKLAQLVVEAGFPLRCRQCYSWLRQCSWPGPFGASTRSQDFVDWKHLGRSHDYETSSKTNLKRVTLELGGKSPNIVFDDADLDQAVRWSSRGIFHHSGQMCTAGSRIFVQNGIFNKFLESFTAISKAGKTGSIFDTRLSMTSTDAGAKIHARGQRLGNEGYYIQPTIFVEATPNMKIVREENFGPVVVIVRSKDEAEVIAMANDTVYGVASSVFTRDISRAHRMVSALDAGCVNINMASLVDSRVPFGGIKYLGEGKELGDYALEAYTNVKAVHVNIVIDSYTS